jgi:pyruvate,water dikinase
MFRRSGCPRHRRSRPAIVIKGIAASGNRHRAGSCPRRPQDFGQDATRRRAGGQHHHARMDLAVSRWPRGCHRHRGPLSHSSIVAREYGIPAVLGTAVATGDSQRPADPVDGDAGTVRLLDGTSQHRFEPPTKSTASQDHRCAAGAAAAGGSPRGWCARKSQRC